LPIVEANSQRVLSRWLGQRGDVRSGPVKAWLWKAAEAVLPPKRAGDFNQALMELGALICTPTRPKCGECPLATGCVARRENAQEEMPGKSPKPTTVAVEEVAVVVRRGDTVLLAQRPANASRWAGMWEFPHAERRADEPEEAAGPRVVAELTGLQATLGPELLVIRHAVTRFRIRMACREATWQAGEFASLFYSAGVWVETARLGEFPVSAPQRRLARALAEPRQGKLF
jgi:A/G-specific adenine glycosylase